MNGLKVLIKVAVSGLLLSLLLLKVNVREVGDSLGRLTPEFVLFAWGYYALCQLLSSYRWQLFLTAKRIQVSLPRLFSFYMIGMFLNNFMPGAVGGDLAKTYYLYRETGTAKDAVTSVFLERFTGLLGLSVLSVVALVIGWQRLHSPLVLAAVGGTALFLGAVVLVLWWGPLARLLDQLLGKLLPPRFGRRLRQVYAALGSYREHRGPLVAAVVLSVGIQGLYALFYTLVSRELGTPIELQYFILFLPLVTVVTMVPVSIGGLGIREALLIVLFDQVGVPAAPVLAVSLTAYLLNTLLSLSGAVLLVVLRKPGPVPEEVRGDA